MMATFARTTRILMASAACAALASCDGADSVASPGAGDLTIITPPPPAPAPSPSPTASPTPSPITAAQFAAQTTQSNVTITSDEQLAIVNAGQNNDVNGVGAQLNGIYPAGATSLAPAGNPATLGGFFQTTAFVGATSGPNDTAFQGWTCNSTTAQFGGSSQACTAVPNIGAGGATATCPAGTETETALVATFRICRLPQRITSSLTLPRIAGVVYRFRGQTEVGTPVGPTGADTGVTLTIQPGVVLAADSTEASPDVLVVNRGSRINAVGTPTEPIIFTAQQNLASNGVSETSQGLWGGVVLLGRAPLHGCSASNDADGGNAACETNIEGLTGVPYGGPAQNDSSGTMQYVQIRYTGIAITDGNELQGLTLGGVGSGTVLNNIQSHNSADDGIEIFGGTANLRYLAITGADDDGIDIDNGYRGFIQFMIAAQRLGGATADSFSTEIESNNNEDFLPRTFGRYANFTFIQTAAAPAAIRLRGGADIAFINGIVRTPAGVAAVNIISGAGAGAERPTIRPANEALQDVGPPTFTSVYFAAQGR